MLNYEMWNPKAWLSAELEQVMDLCVRQQQHGNDLFTHFTQVLQQSNPLIPLIIMGPLSSLLTWLQALWDAVPHNKVLYHDLKSELLAGFSDHLRHLSLFNEGRVEVEAEHLPLEGLSFYTHHPSWDPQDPPFLYAKCKECLKAIKLIYFLTLILSTADDAPSVSDMPEGPLLYIPYYLVPQHITAPKCRNVASLAMAAKFFQLDTCPKQYHIFDFNLTVDDWTWAPDTLQEVLSAGDEAAYHTIAALLSSKNTQHAVVSFLVLKLLTVMKEVSTDLTLWEHK